MFDCIHHMKNIFNLKNNILLVMLDLKSEGIIVEIQL